MLVEVVSTSGQKTDITKLINESSYRVDSARDYTSWINVYGDEMRTYNKNGKISGSFEVVIAGQIASLDTVQKFTQLMASTLAGDERVRLNVLLSNTGAEVTKVFHYRMETKRVVNLGDRTLTWLNIEIEE